MFEIKISPPQEFKVNFEDGTFEGFPAAYGNVDQGGDRLMYGSGKHIAETNPTVPIYFGHGWMNNERPLGKSLFFDERKEGLFSKGQIFETPAGQEVLTGMRENVITVMSIGWKPEEAHKVKEGGKTIREVTKWNILEYSVLPTGMAMNPQALITAVKSLVAKSRSIRGVTDMITVGGDLSWESVEDIVMLALRSYYRESGDFWIEERDMSASAIIYDLFDYSDDGSQQTLQMDYSVDASGAVVLSGDPVPVSVRVTYEPATEGGKAAAVGKSDLTDEGIKGKDYRSLREFYEKSDPVGVLLDEATYLHALSFTLKAEGRDEEVRKALSEVESASRYLKALCTREEPTSGSSELAASIRAVAQKTHEAALALASH